MNTVPGRWRRLAVKLARHAARVLPGAPSPWADAMRCELDYIGDDPAALRWALGCVLASYRVRLTHRPCFGARTAWRQVATSGVLMLLIGLALLENAGGQTEPPRPAFDEIEPPCRGTDEQPRALDGISPCRPQCEAVQPLRSEHRGGVHRSSGPGTGPIMYRSDCTDPLPHKIPTP